MMVLITDKSSTTKKNNQIKMDRKNVNFNSVFVFRFFPFKPEMIHTNELISVPKSPMTKVTIFE